MVSGSTVLRNSYFQYSTTATNPGSLLNSAVWTGGTAYLTSAATYNANGMLHTTTDANSHGTTINEGVCGTPTTITPPIATLDVNFTWDSGCDGVKLMSTTDPNGAVSSSTYTDPFWRMTSVTDPLLNTAGIQYTYSPTTVAKQMTFPSGGSVASDFNTLATADAIGRPLYSQQIEAASGSWDTVQFGYSWNSTGPVTTRTMPCATIEGSGCSTPTTSVTHDALGRPLVTTDGGLGTVTKTYTPASSSCANLKRLPTQSRRRRS